ncbi:ABC transporter permease [Clostridium sp. AM58-1XD]|uniref:ABC transporter permease n=1 Tax=Clostridium sp. AM58-1XD TaxID=2292307 RepID=UPI000E4A99ED|nr:ABC transporter permease [Clostridium sp. AM58-1XD]RGY98734.1 ABC transporter permease [Clostridium sp. AM58-1XD]
MKKRSKLAGSLINVFLPILLAFGTGAILILAAGHSPLETYRCLISQSLFTKDGLMGTLCYASPLIMTGLAVAITFKAQIINMGVEGQMYIGAFVATWAGFTFTNLPMAVHLPLCILLAMAAGALFASVAGVFKAVFHINEIVVTLMLNYVATIFTEYLTSGPFKQNIGYTATAKVASSAMLPRLTPSTTLSAAILFAVACVPVFWFIYNKTKLGYEVDTIGKNIGFADAAGMNVRRKIMIIMVISGAVAGLAGATEMLGVHRRFTPTFSSNPGLGWDGMLVALMGANNPVGVFVAAIFFGALKYGSTTLQSYVGVPYDIITVIQSLLILFLAVDFVKKNPWAGKTLSSLFPGKRNGQAAVSSAKEEKL